MHPARVLPPQFTFHGPTGPDPAAVEVSIVIDIPGGASEEDKRAVFRRAERDTALDQRPRAVRVGGRVVTYRKDTDGYYAGIWYWR